MNLGHGPTHHKCFVAQWLEHLTSVWKVIQVVGLIPVGDSDFSLSCTCDMLITVFLISTTSLKFTIFLYLSKEIPYYWPHVFWVTVHHSTVQAKMIWFWEALCKIPKLYAYHTAMACFCKKLKDKKKTVAKKTYLLLVCVFPNCSSRLSYQSWSSFLAFSRHSSICSFSSLSILLRRAAFSSLHFLKWDILFKKNCNSFPFRR